MLVSQAPNNLKKSLELDDQHFRVNFYATTKKQYIFIYVTFFVSLKVLGAKKSNVPYSFEELDQYFNHIGLDKNVRESVYKVLAAILHLCNLEFHEDTSQNAKILYEVPLSIAAKLLKVDFNELKNALTIRQFKTRAESSSIL